jgi:deazaflavin-dependent oxidoreductase (nitroreductase family)
MSKPHYNFFSITTHKIFSTRIGSQITARVLHHIDKFLNKLSGGKIVITGLSGLPVVFVTTTGARSGQPRTLPLVAIHDRQNSGVFAVVASNFGQKNYPAWYYNMKAHPQVTCSIHEQAQAYVAREAEGEEYQRFWGYAQEIYMGFSKYKQRASHRRIPIMILEPLGGTQSVNNEQDGDNRGNPIPQ